MSAFAQKLVFRLRRATNRDMWSSLDERRNTRSTLTRTALVHFLATLRRRVDAEYIVLSTLDGLALAWAGDTAECTKIAAAVPTPDLLPEVDFEGVVVHHFELAGTPVLLSLRGVTLDSAEIERCLGSLRRIWSTTAGNGLGMSRPEPGLQSHAAV